jgi:hypothetical protein
MDFNSFSKRKIILDDTKDVFNYIDDEYIITKMIINAIPINRNPLEEIEAYILIEYDKNKNKWESFCKDLIKSIGAVESIVEEIKFSQFIVHYNGEKCQYVNNKDKISNLISLQNPIIDGWKSIPKNINRVDEPNLEINILFHVVKEN